MNQATVKPAVRRTAREILRIIPLVMRTVAAELRAAGQFPAPAHFSLLTTLCQRERSLTELAAHQGVSLPTISNSISAMAERGWVRRTASGRDRRVVVIKITAVGRAVLERVGRAAEGHLSRRLAPLAPETRRTLEAGLAVLDRAFMEEPRKRATTRTGRPPRRRPRTSS